MRTCSRDWLSFPVNTMEGWVFNYRKPHPAIKRISTLSLLSPPDKSPVLWDERRKLETEAWGDLWFKTLSILFRKISGTVPSPIPAADNSSVSHQCSFQLWDRDSFSFHMNILNSSQAHNFNKNVVFTVYPFLVYFGKVRKTDQKGTKKKLPSKPSWDGLTLFLLRSKCHRSSKEQDE